LVAEAPEPRNHGLPAFLECAELAIFRKVTAKVAERAPGSLGSARGFGFANWMLAKTTIANVMRSIVDLFGFSRTNYSHSSIRINSHQFD
jgi:hypothetical protein